MSPYDVLNIEGKEYVLLSNTQEVGAVIKTNQRCAYETTFGRLPAEFNEIKESAQKTVDIEKELEILCTQCQTSLTSQGIAMLLMSGAFGQSLFAGEQVKSLAEGKCPDCGNEGCFYIFDPEGL